MKTIHTILILGGVAVVAYIFKDQIMDVLGNILGGNKDPVDLDADANQTRITLSS